MSTFVMPGSAAEFMQRADSTQVLLGIFRDHRRFVLTSHSRPDGDSVGSMLALSAMLRQLGCETLAVVADPVPPTYSYLPGVDQIVVAESLADLPGFEDAPCILLECDGLPRSGLTGFGNRLLINIDHHASGRSFGSYNWIDPDACAVAAMVYAIAVDGQFEITPAIATCLYTAILFDTGGFTHNGTTAATLFMAHDLALRGAHPAHVARSIYFSNTEGKSRVLGAALTNMQRDGPLAWTSISLQEMQRAGAVIDDCEGIVNYLISIEGVESAAFFRELPGEDAFRLSLRSKGNLDVAAVAEMFGGGGHRSASGCTLAGPLAHAEKRVLGKLRSGLC